MKLHLFRQPVIFGSRCVLRGAAFLLMLLVATLAAAQNPMIHNSAARAAQLKGTEQSTPVVSAPTQQEAGLARSEAIPFLELAAAENRGQSSSQDAAQNSAPTSKSAATSARKTKPPHHTLGIVLAVVGTAALVAGVALYAGEKTVSVCNGTSSGCNEAKDTGIALMPIGAGVAVTGFYLQFHR